MIFFLLLAKKYFFICITINHIRYKIGGASKPSPYFAGWDRLAVAGGDLMLLQSPRHGCAGWDRLGKAC